MDEIKKVEDVAKMVAAAGMNNVSVLANKTFTGTYWISANDLYFCITGRHLNADFESGVVPINSMFEQIIAEADEAHGGSAAPNNIGKYE